MTVNVTEARANLYKLIDDTVVNHEAMVITEKRGNAVLLAEDDWNAINETLHLLSVPGMRESIIEGMQEGRNSPAYNGGNFSPVMDNPTHHFHKWIATNLV